MVHQNLHNRESDDTAIVEHGRTPETTKNPSGKAAPNTHEEPQKRTSPKDGKG